MTSTLEVIPLGGLGEFGMNCCALRCGEEMILVDAGVSFPGGPLAGLGIDLIVPDTQFLKEHREQLKGVFLTHGHEDHAGAIPYILEELPVPVFASPLTLGLVEQRLSERKLSTKPELVTLKSRQIQEVGCFRVEPLFVTHSFPESYAFGIETPVGRIIWTGDFKFDQTPIDQRLSDVRRLAEYGEDGVLALFSDSTNSDVDGLAPSENSVIEPLRTLFLRADGKIVVSCFASSIHRIQIILDLAREFRRKVVVAGRSMVSSVAVGSRLGYLRIPPDLLISVSECTDYPAERVLVLATGSQGEPMAALSRLALNEFKKVTVDPGDIVILSTRIIPGNEKLIANLVNHFCRRGAKVYDSRHSRVHASGHGFRSDLKLMMNLTKPRFFIPIHGEFRQLQDHAFLAAEQGIPSDRIFIVENGDVLRLTADSAEISGEVPVGRRLLDEGTREEVDQLVVRDRRFLSEDGFLVVVVRMDRFSGELIGEPEIVSRGLLSSESSETLIESLGEVVLQAVSETPKEEKQDEEVLKEILISVIKRYVRKRTGKRPVIIPVTLEI